MLRSVWAPFSVRPWSHSRFCCTCQSVSTSASWARLRSLSPTCSCGTCSQPRFHVPPARIETAHGWRSRLSAWRDSRVLMIGVLVLGFALAEGSANDWLSLAMVDGHGVSQAAGAAIFGVFVAAMTIGRAGGMLVLDRFGRVPVLR